MFGGEITFHKPQSKEPIAVIPSPFETRDNVSDVTFLVDGKELHFCKSILAASSPVFEKMFSSDFKEKESSAIPLPDKTFEEMDIFLQQLHPVHSWKPLNGQYEDVPLVEFMYLPGESYRRRLRSLLLYFGISIFRTLINSLVC